MKMRLAIYHLARADFLERIRRYGFLVTLGLMVYLGYAVNTGQVALRLGDYRGVYNSAWVGSLMALVVTTLLSLFGFYLVKGAVERDDLTGVGQIMAATPMTRPAYTLGKWLSNFAVLALIVGILAGAALVMQLTQREAAQLDIAALLAPLAFVALPMMGIIASVAVLFETIGWLRGGLGNVVYFFAWAFAIPASLAPLIAGRALLTDPYGLSLFVPSMEAALKAVHPDFAGGFTLGIEPVQSLQTFVWPGVVWTPARVLLQIAWLAAAVGLAFLAAVFFNRFDSSRESRRAARRQAGSAAIETMADPAAAAPLPAAAAYRSAASLSPVHPGYRFLPVWLAELKLILRGQRWWWFAIAAILIAGGLLSSSAAARQIWLPLAWVWPALLWSGMGSRENRHRTGQLLFSAPHPLRRQLPALWLAGVGVAALTGAGVALRLVLGADWIGLSAWLVAVPFIPALALTLGVWSGSSKLFEIVYLLLWYAGPISRAPGLDYMGATSAGLPGIYLALTAALLAAAVIGRQQQIRA